MIVAPPIQARGQSLCNSGLTVLGMTAPGGTFQQFSAQGTLKCGEILTIDEEGSLESGIVLKTDSKDDLDKTKIATQKISSELERKLEGRKLGPHTARCEAGCKETYLPLYYVTVEPTKTDPNSTCAAQTTDLQSTVFSGEVNGGDLKKCFAERYDQITNWIIKTTVSPSITGLQAVGLRFLDLEPTEFGIKIAQLCGNQCAYYTSVVFEKIKTPGSCAVRAHMIVRCDKFRDGETFTARGHYQSRWICSK